ncbi:septum formation protein Maf [Candidatus Peribacteria bacterium RIFCSPHIGHO2_01_FULL_51_9]|nr:MAG: septum formation protein Maf [Candidatus Peribacteria bacterium RIFCSPHIGHO2_01_FULL_51_9]
MQFPLILASASPQRKTLLEGLGLDFEVVPSSIDERDCREKNPAKRAVQLASLKAKDVAKKQSGKWIIGCDTLVEAHDGTILEKPIDALEAREMIEKQSGKTSLVHSGLSLIDPKGSEVKDLSTSSVRFKKLSTKEIDDWIGHGLWQGRSGSFQIDGLGQFLIEHIEGDWTSIVGFPVFLFGQLADKAGLRLS